MKIAVCSDELYPVNEFVVKELERLGHQVILFGALHSRNNESWIQVAQEAAESIHQRVCDEGIFFCWTGTGVSIVANKTPGIRAALCTDAQTARGARVWNRANVLALSNRLLTQDLAKEILSAWFESVDDDNDVIDKIRAIERANISRDI
ncbi:RpiB/LacA/LacB family sugar-phosphate isomerase [Legionella fallonii]|uniref:Putative ribose/galactose isomerase n=1 Tax=Legionella fallonii LLAP-10 TaxID=1212491 RepID=A0A098G2A8_9GAMM|nr:RpiB/LacA/LacB family sugar-phosphate isomerase [Legionella fallonii]CEG56121.1 putative ribose/galactose isomerase [Legionella fallonii LLAP-10]